MNREAVNHPTEDDLLRYLDGETGPDTLEGIRFHLNSCWDCRLRANEIQEAIIAFARERERTPVPQPPSGWKDLTPHFRVIQQTSPAPPWFSRFRSGLIFCVAPAAAAALGWVALRPARVIEKQSKPGISAPSRPDIVAGELPSAITSAFRIERVSPSNSNPFTIHDEVAAVAELHRIHADLGAQFVLHEKKACLM